MSDKLLQTWDLYLPEWCCTLWVAPNCTTFKFLHNVALSKSTKVLSQNCTWSIKNNSYCVILSYAFFTQIKNYKCCRHGQIMITTCWPPYTVLYISKSIIEYMNYIFLVLKMYLFSCLHIQHNWGYPTLRWIELHWEYFFIWIINRWIIIESSKMFWYISIWLKRNLLLEPWQVHKSQFLFLLAFTHYCTTWN